MRFKNLKVVSFWKHMFNKYLIVCDIYKFDC